MLQSRSPQNSSKFPSPPNCFSLRPPTLQRWEERSSASSMCLRRLRKQACPTAIGICKGLARLHHVFPSSSPISRAFLLHTLTAHCPLPTAACLPRESPAKVWGKGVRPAELGWGASNRLQTNWLPEQCLGKFSQMGIGPVAPIRVQSSFCFSSQLMQPTTKQVHVLRTNA